MKNKVIAVLTALGLFTAVSAHNEKTPAANTPHCSGDKATCKCSCTKNGESNWIVNELENGHGKATVTTDVGTFSITFPTQEIDTNTESDCVSAVATIDNEGSNKSYYFYLADVTTDDEEEFKQSLAENTQTAKHQSTERIGKYLLFLGASEAVSKDEARSYMNTLEKPQSN